MSQCKDAEPFTVLSFPAADALMVTGPPTATHVAAPVFASMVAMFASEEFHCAGRLSCVSGARLKVPVALNGTLSPRIAVVLFGWTVTEIS
jgi:hypothetical protein